MLSIYLVNSVCDGTLLPSLAALAYTAVVNAYFPKLPHDAAVQYLQAG